MHEPQQAYEEQDRVEGLGGPRPVGTTELDRTPEFQETREVAHQEVGTGSSHRVAAGDSAERVGLLNNVPGLREQWQQVQVTFVDDPQQAVREAGQLVNRTIDEIRANVGSERSSDAMSTEDLRVSFQRYREFFQRLLSA